MRVGLDYLPASTHAPGVGRYARELTRALAPLQGRPELVLAELGRPRPSIGEPALGLAGHPGLRRVQRPWPRRAWTLLETLGAGPERWLGPLDLFQRIRSLWPPVRRVPVVRAISELPEPGDPGEEQARAELDADDAWIAFSEAAEEALVERFGRPAERVFRTPVGCDHWTRELPGLADGAGPLEPADPPYLLVLGAVRRARHPDLVLDAFDSLAERERDLRLVFCGGRGDASELLESRLRFSSGRSRVEWIRSDERELPELVARAGALVHLTDSEWTAVTPLEALAAGTPVVVSDRPAFREALGDEAWYVTTPPSRRHRLALPDQLAEALASSRDPDARRRRRELGSRFPWSGCARATLDVWRDVAGS